jgi:DNA polymerase-3 subunit chi
MTRVDFYILQPAATGNRYTLACRLAEKAWQQQRRILISVTSDEELRHMDRLLWTWREQSFIPHGILGAADARLNPILISAGADPADEHDVLINLRPEVPAYFSRFERVAECVDQDETQKATSRDRYRFYRDHGYPLNSHQIR